MGHVNNCAYAAYAEAGRTMFLGGLLDSEMHPSIDFILASVKIDYLKEMFVVRATPAPGVHAPPGRRGVGR